MATSEYIRHVVRVHHRITVIHPFKDGNGRTSRAFMNVQFVRFGINPMYIRVEDKKEYLSALEMADLRGEYAPLNEIIFKSILRVNTELLR